MINIVGWIGNFGVLLGAILLAKKIRFGWCCQILANICYVIYSVMLGNAGLSLLALSFILVIVNYYGLKKWQGENKWITIRY